MARDGSLPLVSRFRGWLQRPDIRRVLRIVGLVLVTAGAIWSAATLDLTWSALSPSLLVFNLFVLSPIILFLAAIAFRINARAIGCDIAKPRSLYTVATANVAELLPLPGGAVVRGAALVDAGASLADSTRMVVLASLLTLFMSLTLSLSALTVLAQAQWVWLALASTLGLAGVIFALIRFVGLSSAAAMLGIRVVILVFSVFRVGIAFATLGPAIGWIEAALYTVAPTLGSMVAIVPAGLGVNEAIAAGLAALVAASSASAFLAIAMNRVLALVAGAVMVVLLPLIQGASVK